MNVTYQTRRRQSTRSTEIYSRGSAQVFGYNLFYEAAGRAERGPTILCLHESGGSSSTWQGQLSGLAQYTRCIVPDLPGHGRSEGPSYPTVAEYREAILAFLDALAIRWPVVVAGVCLGASVAVDLALHAPHRITGLILSGVSEGGRACQATRDAAALGQALDLFVEHLFGPNISVRLLQERLARWRLTDPTVRHGALSALSAYPLTQSLCKVSHPVLLMAGGKDLIATPESTLQMAAQMTGARVEIIPDSGCLSMVERPVLYNRAVTDFLNRLRMASPIEADDRQTNGYRRSVTYVSRG